MSDLKSMYSTLQKDEFPDNLEIKLGNEKLIYKRRVWNIDNEEKGLRYGENPDQAAALYQMEKGNISLGGISFRTPDSSLISALNEKQMIQAGKHPGKTNLTDVDNGANILQYLTDKASAVILKHNNPSGAAWSDCGIEKALEKAFWCDRIAAFGGAIVVNRPLTIDAAKIIDANYFEVVAAPAFEDGVIEILKKRKNLRIMELPKLAELQNMVKSAFIDIKSLSDGGLILQKSFVNRILKDDDFLPAIATKKDGLQVSARKPNKRELSDLRFAWAVESGVTSNSVIFAKDGATVAIGTGEQDRVGCVELAIYKAHTKYSDSLAFKEQQCSLYELVQKANKDAHFKEILDDIKIRTHKDLGGLKDSCLVSDGFFPFRDGVDVAISQGVSAIAHPGGSLRDYESIIACNEASPQVGMVFTGQRSFRH